MTYKTFKEWDELGFYVIFGEKSHNRNIRGEPTFSSNQVDEKDELFPEFCPEEQENLY